MTDGFGKNSDGGVNQPHTLIQLHEPPEGLIRLRKELSYHPDISAYAQAGGNFEDVLGRIALKLDIALDGIYDANQLCHMLTEALENRRIHPTQPHLRAKGLMDVELVEREGDIMLSLRDRNVSTSVPEGSVVTEVNRLPTTEQYGTLVEGSSENIYKDDPAAVSEETATDSPAAEHQQVPE